MGYGKNFSPDSIIFFNCVVHMLFFLGSSVSTPITAYAVRVVRADEAEPVNSSQAPQILFQRKRPDYMAYSGERARIGTDRIYYRALWVYHYSFGGHLPADWDSVSSYISWLLQSYARGTIQTYVSALISWHRENGHPAPGASMPIGAKYSDFYIAARPRQQLPVPLESLTSLIQHIGRIADSKTASGSQHDAETLQVIACRAMLVIVLMYCGRVHIKKVCSMTFEDISVRDALLIQTSPETGDLTVFPTFATLDPVSFLRKWQDLTALGTGFVIRRLSTNGQVKAEKASYKSIQKEITSYISTANINVDITSKLISWGPGLKDCPWRDRTCFP